MGERALDGIGVHLDGNVDRERVQLVAVFHPESTLTEAVHYELHHCGSLVQALVVLDLGSDQVGKLSDPVNVLGRGDGDVEDCLLALRDERLWVVWLLRWGTLVFWLFQFGILVF